MVTFGETKIDELKVDAAQLDVKETLAPWIGRVDVVRRKEGRLFATYKDQSFLTLEKIIK